MANGAIVIAAALLCSGPRHSPSPPAVGFRTSSATFSPGQNPPPGAAGRNRPATAARSLERRRRRLRPSPDDGERDPGGGGEFSTIASPRCGPMPHAATFRRKFRALHRGADARSAHHGPDRFAARIHQGDLGLSRHPRERQPPRQGPRDPHQIQAAIRCGGEGLWRRPLHRSLRSGASNRITRRRWAIAACSIRPRRWPASAAARPISRTSF